MEDFDTACRLVAQRVSRKEGVWSYQAFDYINSTYFDSALPTPLIVWALTPYGHCIGSSQSNPSVSPLITLHPNLLFAGPKEAPWGIERRYLGVRFVFETLIHECMHVNVHYRLGGETGESSHNCKEWVSEVNRIAPLIGISDVRAEITKVKRIPIKGQFTKTGKPKTKPARVTDGNMSLKELEAFPHRTRRLRDMMAYYTEKTLPFPNVLCDCDVMYN